MNIKKFSHWLLLLAILLLSIKVIIFTGDLILAGYFLNSNNKEKAAAFMYRIICHKPIVYRSFRDSQKTLLEDTIVKKAIYTKYRDNKNIFATFSLTPGLKELTLERFKTVYSDNVYLQNLFPPTLFHPNWENLDAVSLELLGDKSLNPLTLALWEKAKATANPEFTAILTDYCRWQGNTALADYLEKDSSLSPKHFLISRFPTQNESFMQLLKTIRKNNKLTNKDIKENPSGSEDFNDLEIFKEKWEFSCITGNKDHRTASFTMGLDGTGENQNHCLRLMGFFVDDGDSVTKPRGGAMHKEKLLIPEGYYLLSFDYLTVTGLEKPSLYLWKGLSEVYLPPTAVRWKKVVYILDNSTGEYGIIKPFFRMWGTGKVLIDNMIVARITKSPFITRRKALVYINEWK